MEFDKLRYVNEGDHPSNDSKSILTKKSTSDGINKGNNVNEEEETLLNVLFNDIESGFHVNKSFIQFILKEDRIYVHCALCAKSFKNLFITILGQPTNLLVHLRSKQHLKSISRNENIDSLYDNYKNTVLQAEILKFIFRDSRSLYESNASFIRFDKRKMSLCCKACRLSNFNVVSNLKGQLSELVDHFKTSEHMSKSGEKKQKVNGDSCHNNKLDKFSANELSEIFLKHIPIKLSFSYKYVSIVKNQPFCSICCCVLRITPSDYEGIVYLHITGQKHKSFVHILSFIRKKTFCIVKNEPKHDLDVDTFFNESKALMNHSVFIKSCSIRNTDESLIYCKLCKCYLLKNNVAHTLKVHINGKKHQKLFIRSLVKMHSEPMSSKLIEKTDFRFNNINNIDTRVSDTTFSENLNNIKLLNESGSIQFFCNICNRRLHCLDKINLQRHLNAKKHLKKLFLTTKEPIDKTRLNGKQKCDSRLTEILNLLPKYFKNDENNVIFRNRNVQCLFCKVNLFSIVDFELDETNSIKRLLNHLKGKYHCMNRANKSCVTDVIVDSDDKYNIVAKLRDFKIKEYFYNEKIPIYLYYNQPYITVVNPTCLFCIACSEVIIISVHYDYLFQHIINKNHVNNVKEININDIISIIYNRCPLNYRFNKCLDNIIYYLFLNRLIVIQISQNMYRCQLCQKDIQVRSFQKLGNLFAHIFDNTHLHRCSSYAMNNWSSLCNRETITKSIFDDIIKNIHFSRRNMIENVDKAVWTAYCKLCCKHYRITNLKELVSHLSIDLHSPNKILNEVKNTSFLNVLAKYDSYKLGKDVNIFSPESFYSKTLDLSQINGKINHALYADYLTPIKVFEECTYFVCILCNCVLISPTVRTLIAHLTSIVHVRNFEYTVNIV